MTVITSLVKMEEHAEILMETTPASALHHMLESSASYVCALTLIYIYVHSLFCIPLNVLYSLYNWPILTFGTSLNASHQLHFLETFLKATGYKEHVSGNGQFQTMCLLNTITTGAKSSTMSYH